jgi:prepilin-type N-terminal cleavage/methylation domain-containing protein
MIINDMKGASRRGFTILELMIASAVFSVVLLVALTGFIQIGRFFYKGVSAAQTQTVANQIMNEFSSGIQQAASVTIPGVPSANGYNYYCIGNNRYTYILKNEVKLSAAPNYSPDGNFGLLRDTLPGSSPCAPPCPDLATGGTECPGGYSPSAVSFQNPAELLGQYMRLGAFDITQSASNPKFYNINLTVA